MAKKKRALSRLRKLNKILRELAITLILIKFLVAELIAIASMFR